MTKKSPKVFLENLWISPTKENMTKFYKYSRTISEIKKGQPYIDEWYNQEVKNFRKSII